MNSFLSETVRVCGTQLTLSATSVTFSVTVFPATGEECNRREATMVREMDDLASVVRNIVSQVCMGCSWKRDERKLLPGFIRIPYDVYL